MAILIGYLFWIESPTNLIRLPAQQLIIPLGSLVLKILVICTVIITLLTDLAEGIIPDRITYPATFWALLIMLMLISYQLVSYYLTLSKSALGPYLLPPHSNYFYQQVLYLAQPLLTGLISALVIGAFFASLILLTRGRGMGGGDLKLGIFMGLVLGFPGSLVALMLAFLTGSIAGIVLLLLRRKHFGQTIPFGPFLSLGTIISLFWGNQLVDWYLNFRTF